MARVHRGPQRYKNAEREREEEEEEEEEANTMFDVKGGSRQLPDTNRYTRCCKAEDRSFGWRLLEMMRQE